MNKKYLIRTSMGCLILAPLMAAALWFLYRPWALTWGSTAEEIARRMPGGEVLEQPTFNATTRRHHQGDARGNLALDRPNRLPACGFLQLRPPRQRRHPERGTDPARSTRR